MVSVFDSQSGGPGFECRSDHSVDLFHASPEFKSSATLVNRQLVCLRQFGILNNVELECSIGIGIIWLSCLLGSTVNKAEGK